MTCHDCCMCSYTISAITIFCSCLMFGTYMLTLWSLSKYIDTCSDDLFHCNDKTYAVAASVLVGFALLMLCICKLSKINCRKSEDEYITAP